MNGMGKSGKRGGNPILLYVAAGLLAALIALLLLGYTRSASVETLLSAAAPDSSEFRQDSTLIAGDAVQEEPAATEEAVAEEPETGADTAASPTAAVPGTADSSTVPAEPAPVTPVSVSSSGTGEQVVTYTIRKGDTLYKIAALFGNKPSDLVSMNALPDMNVQAGKPLKVKVKAMHAVGEGEGLLAIAGKYGVPVRSIRLANGLQGDAVPSGSTLIIPLK